jgi:hypothetical protein
VEAILDSFLEFLADQKVLQGEAEEESHFLHYQSDTLQNCAVMASNVTRQESAVALKEEGACLVADLQGTMVVVQVVELNLEVEGGELEIMVVKGVETEVL